MIICADLYSLVAEGVSVGLLTLKIFSPYLIVRLSKMQQIWVDFLYPGRNSGIWGFVIPPLSQKVENTKFYEQIFFHLKLGKIKILYSLFH